jgi:hypothetical protein
MTVRLRRQHPSDVGGTMFEATHGFGFFDYFRVPYSLASAGNLPGGGRLSHALGALWTAQPGAGNHPCLLWFRPDPRARRPGRFKLNGIPIVGSVASDAVAWEGLRKVPGMWRAAEPISDERGRRVTSVWRDQRDGNIYLPFDPGELMQALWSERYPRLRAHAVIPAAKRAILRSCYLLRPVIPRNVPLRLRRSVAREQARSPFPRWPIEDALHDLYAWLFGVVAEIAGAPVPWLDMWPNGCSWALVLTHDVESETGLRQRHLLRDPERDMGYCSSWNMVAQRYEVDDADVRALQDEGCEVGVHGLRHDGRDLGSQRLLRQRLPAMRAAATRWNAVGFRSPATQRRWEWMPSLGFDYDTSWTDTDPYEPQSGGCCTYLPFFNDNLVELPITLPQDHTLFAILGQPDGQLWLRKAQHIRAQGGMVLMLTHPDYASDRRVVEGYRSVLAAFEADPTVWHALPREVAAWWRRRAASTPQLDGTGWRIAGPAAGEGRVRFAATPSLVWMET